DLLSVIKSPSYRLVPHPVYEIFGREMAKGEARRKLDIGRDDKIVLFFGYIRKYKGLHILLDAVKEALASVGFTLLVAGEFYDNEKSYRDQIDRLGIGGSVRVFSDYITNEDVAAYFSASDVVVLPYIDATQSGIAQIAYNFNKPVITTDVGGLAEIVVDGKTGLVVPPNSPGDLAAAIVRFFRQNLADSFASGVAEEKRLYSWDNLVSAIEQLTEHSTNPHDS
ncbi:MAG TPA: glycosyltransferase, partial [Candidatus Kryptobacter bacterium]|nr:glycosyltransferase [Candidatus Kryptobacter bacterium]